MQATGVNWFLTITELLGGLALFIWGMQIMADGLQKGAGDRLRFYIEKLTRTPIHGFTVGTIITALVHSSSAVGIMTVGLVNAGLMSLAQALGIILGANVGTTITAQMIAFKVDWLIMPAIAIGILLKMLATKKAWKVTGEVLLGFGILFLGMRIMSGSVDFIEKAPQVKDFLASVSSNLYLGIVAGIVLTAIIQSSSAVSALCIVLINAGLLSVPGACAVMLGANIGTCADVLMSTIGANFSAKKVALAHILYNVIGVLIYIPFIESGISMRILEATSTEPARQLANFHTFFNLFTSVAFLPFTAYFVKLLGWMVKGKDVKVEFGTKFISSKFLPAPSLALEQATQELVRMIDIAKSMVIKAKEMTITRSKKLKRVIQDNESTVDELQVSITSFLTNLTQKSLSLDQAERSVVLLHAVHDAERIGDHAMNLAELAEGLMEANVKFSDTAEKSLIELYDTVDESCQLVSKALHDYDVNLALKMYELEDKIDYMAYEIRESHVRRLKTMECKPENGIYFLDMASNLERIGDHCLNIAQAVIGDHEKRIIHDEEES